MARKPLSGLFSTLFLVPAFLTFSSFWSQTRSDDPCTYPCYPPPAGTGGSSTIPTPMIRTPPTPSGSYYPPPTSYSYPPPAAGYIPYNQQPSGGGFNVPPPPDPVLPYFPFYFKEPLHGSPAVATLQASTVVIVMFTSALVFLVTFSFSSDVVSFLM